MKASEIIEILAKAMAKYGDKRVLVNLGEEVFYEPDLELPGLFNYEDKKPRNGKNEEYLYFDLDFT